MTGHKGLTEIAAAVGDVSRVAYEAAHVYPLSAPAYVERSGAERERPEPGPIKLYTHIPFCNYACSFCFYVKRVGAGREEMERYVRALERELEWVEAGTPLAQLYVGGGTPTALPADLLQQALDAVLTRMPRQDGSSITVECSPESISAEHVRALQSLGVERVSMGIESLSDEVLATLRRRHPAELALDVCDQLLEGGFYLNVDLIYGLPGQTHADFANDLERAAERGVQSISVYNLRLNERTPVASAMKAVEYMDLEGLIDWRTLVERSAVGLGFEQRRWHTFVRQGIDGLNFDRAPCAEGFGPGRQLGIGVSAVSHLGHMIYRNDDRVAPYLERVEKGESPVREVFPLSIPDRRTLLIARTLGDGGVLDRQEYADATGSRFDDEFGETLERLRRAKLVCDDGERIALSEDGRKVYDLVTLAFYPEHARSWLGERQPPAPTVAATR